MSRILSKRTLALALTTALSAASAQSTIDVRLSTASVTMEIGRYGGPLSSLLAAIAKSAGYELVLDANVDAVPAAAGATAAPGAATTAGSSTKPVVYSFTGKPFNEVWPLLMDVYGLSYETLRVGNQSVLRVSSAPIQRVIKLTNAGATATEQRVKLFFGVPKYVTKTTKVGDQDVQERVLEDVVLDSQTLRIIADPAANTLIVRGTNREIQQVEQLVAEIERTNASATGGAGSASAQRIYSVQGSVPDIVALVASQYPGLRVTPVGKTGQLVVSGPASQVDAAFTLLAQVDKAVVVTAGPPIVQRTFTLSNAQATEVKETLDGTLKRELTDKAVQANVPVTATDVNGNPVTVTVPNPAAALPARTQPEDTTAINGATIIADQRTNTLIVRGTQAQVEQIAELIPMLDRAVPQINVQVRIQEISESAARNLGIDWTAGLGNFTTKVISGGLSALFDMTRSFAGFNLGATLNALESQGLSKSIYDGSVTMQSGQRRQGNAGSTESASANAAASIKSGGRLEVNIPSTSGNITKQIDYGVILDFINPQVAGDGTITLGVKSNVSNLETAITGQTIPNVLQFTNREAQTTVSFKNGQTVMLGGLLSTTEKNTRQGIPFISSIPVIGNLFGKTITQRDESQLLIVITGNVVQ